MNVRRGMGRALLGLALAGCGGVESVDTEAISDEAPLPANWRWESYHNLEIGVPGDWGYGVTGRQFCVRAEGEGPFVGRPGSRTDIGCLTRTKDGSDPATLLSSGGVFVWFGADTPKPDPAGTPADPVSVGDRDRFWIDNTQVSIQAPTKLRRQILATVHRIDDKDHNGCPITSTLTGSPDHRPHGPAVTTLTDVRSVSACSYGGETLQSSLRLTGPAAAAPIAAIAAAPIGGGPNAPAGSCGADSEIGAGGIVLLVDSHSGTSEIVVRYGGCSHRGLDDGTTVRTLTRPAVGPFVSGPNQVGGFTGENLSGILRGDRPAPTPPATWVKTHLR
jgi:hypothetical protein